MPVIIDHAQQFTISTTDLANILSRSEPGGKVTTNGAQVSMGITINGQFARHAEVIANEHSEGAEIIRQHANATR